MYSELFGTEFTPNNFLDFLHIELLHTQVVGTQFCKLALWYKIIFQFMYFFYLYSVLFF